MTKPKLSDLAERYASQLVMKEGLFVWGGEKAEYVALCVDVVAAGFDIAKVKAHGWRLAAAELALPVE